MTGELGRGKRNRKRINYSQLNKKGDEPIGKMAKRKKTNNKGQKRKKPQKPLEDPPREESHSDAENEEEIIPGPSHENNEFEIVDDLHSDMGRDSKSSEPETSDVDSADMEEQYKELEELNRQLEEKKAKRSNKERRDRKAKMAEIRRLTEERRKQLQELESDSEGVSDPKKRKTSKSKDGKGVKSSKKTKGKTPNLQDKDKNSKEKMSKKLRRKKTKNIKDSIASLSHSSSESESASDEFTKAVKRIKRKHSQTRKTKRLKMKDHLFVGKKNLRDKSVLSSDTEDSSSDSSSSSNSSSSDESSTSYGDKKSNRRSKHKHKKGKPIKSGVKAKAHKIRLKTSELCAQAVLDEEYCPGTHTLDSLSFDQLVAGELEICTMKDLSKKEKNARLQILKLLAYFANILPQSALIDVYKAVILKIEKGLFIWSSEIVEKAENMLDRAVSKHKMQREIETQKITRTTDKMKEKPKKEFGIQLKNGDKIVYCADFNKNKCDKDSNHEGKFSGRDVTKFHVCRTCLVIDKEKRFHPETDEKCPNKSA